MEDKKARLRTPGDVAVRDGNTRSASFAQRRRSAVALHRANRSHTHQPKRGESGYVYRAAVSRPDPIAAVAKRWAEDLADRHLSRMETARRAKGEG